MHTMGEYFFCNYLWGVIYSMGIRVLRGPGLGPRAGPARSPWAGPGQDSMTFCGPARARA